MTTACGSEKTQRVTRSPAKGTEVAPVTKQLKLMCFRKYTTIQIAIICTMNLFPLFLIFSILVTTLFPIHYIARGICFRLICR